MDLVRTIRERQEERKRKKQAFRRNAQRNDQSQSNTEQTHVEPTTPTPAQRISYSDPTRFFSLRCKRGASIGLSTYENLHNGEEPDIADDRSMQYLGGDELRRIPPSTPPPADRAAKTGLPSTPSPDGPDTGIKTWLGRVGGSIRRKPSLIQAYKTGGIRSAWTCTLPKNWKANNASAAKTITDTTHEVKKSQIRRPNDSDVDFDADFDADNEKRSPLPHHWREQYTDSQDALVNRRSDITMQDSEMGDWIDPDEVKREQEFEDWLLHEKTFVEEWDPLSEAVKRASVFSVQSKRRYSDY